MRACACCMCSLQLHRHVHREHEGELSVCSPWHVSYARCPSESILGMYEIRMSPAPSYYHCSQGSGTESGPGFGPSTRRSWKKQRVTVQKNRAFLFVPWTLSSVLFKEKTTDRVKS